MSDIELFDDDAFEEGEIVTGEYTRPEVRGGVLNTLTNELTDEVPTNVGPWDAVKAMAKSMNITIQDPKKDCKHCYGRGWIGRDGKTKAPIPCQCIYPPMSRSEKKSHEQYMNKVAMSTMNRKQRRFVAKKNAKVLKNMAKERTGE